ncbi:hypothetical protein GRX01_00295 [Halobaculum sp. WSA2]|uniref:Uncharacterized protein n=1 Tax=Halobaculum saliterrae TaxID=2073113 RepID=A0A6B0SSZ6_9EURY|nr:hypothetical protein [Halobaculum saliterrae]MXR39801.1 hypothetical protein [Halobaculum saliterrae]
MVNANRSQNAARYGALAEKVARERYGLEVDHSSWTDARDDEGRPWDVKACMMTRTAPRFRLWKEQHTRLVRASGGYVFVAYRPVGRGIRVLETRTVRASSLRLRFYGAGSHQKGEQVKVTPKRIFE